MSAFFFDHGITETQFLEKLNCYYNVIFEIKSFMNDLNEDRNVIYLNNIKADDESGIFATLDTPEDVKEGEDIGIPAVIPDIPSTIEQILTEPLNIMDVKQKQQLIKLNASIRW